MGFLSTANNVESLPGWTSWSERDHPEDVPRVTAGFQQAVTGAAIEWKDEYRYRRKDDTFAVVQDRGHIIQAMPTVAPSAWSAA